MHLHNPELLKRRGLVMHLHNPELQNALVSKRSKLLSCNIVNRYKYTAAYTAAYAR